MDTISDNRTRQTKYCKQAKTILSEQRHLTNTQLLIRLRQTFPDLSATTVHRVTARLAQRGEIGVAPSSRSGFMRYDATITPHDHFLCLSCDRIRDIEVKARVLAILVSSMPDCQISGRLTISGVCKRCEKNTIN